MYYQRETGKTIEREVFGAIEKEVEHELWGKWWNLWLKYENNKAERMDLIYSDLSPEERQSLQDWLNWVKDESFIDKEVAVDYVKDRQPEKHKKFVRILYELIGEELCPERHPDNIHDSGTQVPDDYDDYEKDINRDKCNTYYGLRFYTAIGSHLDYFDKIDGFFELDVDGETITVTVDVKSHDDESAYDNPEIDYFLDYRAESYDLNDPQDKKDYNEMLIKHGQNIAEVFRSKIRQAKIRKETTAHAA